ncbi:glycosyltransferase, partial [Streptomyces acidiscabies]|uniref:glycosyltransferase n=1 Tax=Streptomyces acidiscabies TaxID=42234 RepID=UPI0038F61D90
TLAFFGIPCGPAAWLLKRLYGIPYAVLLRGGDVPGYQHRGIGPYHAITRPVIRWLWHQADHVIANSAGLAALAQQT